jgi:hypothetical protein
MGQSYVSQPGRYSRPGPDGWWSSAPTPPGRTSPKDGCAYYWLTITGDIFAFNLGDASSGFRAPCPSDLGGRLHSGAPWPMGTNGFDSIGSFPEGTHPEPGGSCTGSLGTGQESYGVTPSDVVWALQQVENSGKLPSGLPLAGVFGAAYVNGFNPAASAPNGAGGPDVTSNASSAPCIYLAAGGSTCPPALSRATPCLAYASAGHFATSLALQWNQPLSGVRTGTSVCSGDPLAASTFGTTTRSDGIRFWTRSYDFDSGVGWEAASRAYGWLTGPGGFDPYGVTTDTCPGSSPMATVGPSEWSCQESVTSGSGTWWTVPGDGVAGMSNSFTSGSGESLTWGT